MRTVSPSPQSGRCVHSHLDPFQTPVERKVIRDEDPLYTLVTDNALQSYNQLLLPAKNQPWKSKQDLTIAIGTDDQATNMAFHNKVTSFKKGHCQADPFLSPSQGDSVGYKTIFFPFTYASVFRTV